MLETLREEAAAGSPTSLYPPSQGPLATFPLPPFFLLSGVVMGVSPLLHPTFWLAGVAPACPRGRCCPCANARWPGQVPSLLHEGLDGALL